MEERERKARKDNKITSLGGKNMRLYDFLQILEKDTSVRIVNKKEEVLVPEIKNSIFSEAARYLFIPIELIKLEDKQFVIVLELS